MRIGVLLVLLAVVVLPDVTFPFTKGIEENMLSESLLTSCTLTKYKVTLCSDEIVQLQSWACAMRPCTPTMVPCESVYIRFGMHGARL